MQVLILHCDFHTISVPNIAVLSLLNVVLERNLCRGDVHGSGDEKSLFFFTTAWKDRCYHVGSTSSVSGAFPVLT